MKIQIRINSTESETEAYQTLTLVLC